MKGSNEKKMSVPSLFIVIWGKVLQNAYLFWYVYKNSNLVLFSGSSGGIKEKKINLEKMSIF